jgi:rhodanese-related sulfurtransferase
VSGAAGDVGDALARMLAAARARIDRLEPQEVAGALAEGAVLVDIRTERQRAAGVVAESIWYPRTCLEWRCAPGSAYLDPAIEAARGRVLLLCVHGEGSSLAAAVLRDLGVSRAGDVVGGFEGWVAAGLPVEPFEERVHALQGSDGAVIRDY